LGFLWWHPFWQPTAAKTQKSEEGKIRQHEITIVDNLFYSYILVTVAVLVAFYIIWVYGLIYLLRVLGVLDENDLLAVKTVGAI